MTELSNNLNVGSERDRDFKNDSVTWFMWLDEQRIFKEGQFGGRMKEEKSWGQFGYIKFEMPLKYVNDIRWIQSSEYKYGLEI